MGSEGILFYMALAFIGTPVIVASLVSFYFIFRKDAE